MDFIGRRAMLRTAFCDSNWSNLFNPTCNLERGFENVSFDCSGGPCKVHSLKSFTFVLRSYDYVRILCSVERMGAYLSVKRFFCSRLN